MLALYCAFVLLPNAPGAWFTPLSLGVGALALWIAGMNLYANPSYTSAASYHAALLAGGYLLGRRSASESRPAVCALLTFGAVASVWALWQVATGEARGHGPFITPATLAAMINLLLLPGLVFVALGERRVLATLILVSLAAALFASQSRGGWIALIAGGVVALALLHRARITLAPTAVIKICAILFFGAITAWLVAHVPGLYASAPRVGVGLPPPPAVAESLASRLELYELAWKGLRGSSLLLGEGYRSFYYVLEAGREAAPSYSAGTTDFVHNDYLQMLYEFGLPGLAGLVLLVVMPLATSWRGVAMLERREQAIVIAMAAGTSSMAVHGIVDFPFYIPTCVLIYAAALGVLDSSLLAARTGARPSVPASLVLPHGVRRAIVAAMGTLCAWVLAMPIAAEVASAYAQRQLADGRAQSAAFWFEAARRLDARDWRYHWYVGQFWAFQAADRADAGAANRADAALAASVAANSREVRSLHTRIVLHRRLRSLLAAPADSATLRAWADRAVQLAPGDPEVRAERERIWQQFRPPKGTG